MQNINPQSWQGLADKIRSWAHELGFQAAGITDTDLAGAEAGLLRWLEQGFHGEMDYMAKHGVKRSRPAELLPGTVRVISVRMNYLPGGARDSEQVLKLGDRAFISRYALGRDYHKVMRRRLALLADRIRDEVAEFDGRVFTDSAPVLEVELASKAGLGWRGKHTLLLSRDQGSWFFLGEIYINLPLPVDAPQTAHCGSCTNCMTVCPTQAIIAPYQLDARRCISYLTIELKGRIPVGLRQLIGNRIYGCDDCQLVCPWNRFAQSTVEADFAVRHGLDDAGLVELFAWDEVEFREKLAGSAIYRIGHDQWLRNIAVALGNALNGHLSHARFLLLNPDVTTDKTTQFWLRAKAQAIIDSDSTKPSENDAQVAGYPPLTGEGANDSLRDFHADAAIVAALQARLNHPSELVREHVIWALMQQGA